MERQPHRSVSQPPRNGPAMLANASPARLVADVIYEAATDGKNQLRYMAGADAHELLSNRKQYDDATFIGGMKMQFWL